MDWLYFSTSELLLIVLLALSLFLPALLESVVADEGFTSAWLSVPILVICTVLAGTWSDWIVSQTTPGSFSTSLTRVDALYFAATTLTTAGSDFHPVSAGARMVVTAQTLVNLLVVAGIVVVVIAKLQSLRGAGARNPIQRP